MARLLNLKKKKCVGQLLVEVVVKMTMPTKHHPPFAADKATYVVTFDVTMQTSLYGAKTRA